MRRSIDAHESLRQPRRDEMLKQVVAGSAGLLFLAACAASAFASDVRSAANLDRNSLQTCESAIRNQVRPVDIRETYHDRSGNGTHVIYANVRTLENGKLENTRVTCQTSVSGLRLEALDTASGRWVENLAYGLSQN